MIRKASKFVAILLIAVALSSNAYAYVDNTNTQIDLSDSNQSNSILVVIYDAGGNVVETHNVSRQLYVNGTQYTIPAYGSLQTYQYYASVDFTVGFYFVHSDYSGNATTRNRDVKITIYNSDTVGGSRRYVNSKRYSTNEENNTSDSGYASGIQPGCTSVSLSVTPVSSRPYYNAVYRSLSSSPLTISLLVSRD